MHPYLKFSVFKKLNFFEVNKIILDHIPYFSKQILIDYATDLLFHISNQYIGTINENYKNLTNKVISTIKKHRCYDYYIRMSNEEMLSSLVETIEKAQQSDYFAKIAQDAKSLDFNIMGANSSIIYFVLDISTYFSYERFLDCIENMIKNGSRYKFSYLQKKIFTWNHICAVQLLYFLKNDKTNNKMENIISNQKLIDYATVILEDDNLCSNLEFLVRDYLQVNA
jgi:hypothetical protein